MGSVSHTRRKLLMDMLVGVATNDAEAVLNALLELSEFDKDIDKKSLKRDIIRFMYEPKKIESMMYRLNLNL